MLNPEVLNPRATFEITSLKVEDGSIKWSTKGESGPLPFIIEQFRWNKWVKVGEITGTGKVEGGDYSAPVRIHTGENKFRIKQIDYREQPRYSKETSLTSDKGEITFSPSKVDDLITFTAPTMYEIYDEYGGIVFKGYGSDVKVGGLQKGKYYINYDNKMDRFTKK